MSAWCSSFGYDNSSSRYQGVAGEVGKSYTPQALAHKEYSNYHIYLRCYHNYHITILENRRFAGQFILQLHTESFICLYFEQLVLHTSRLDGSLLSVLSSFLSFYFFFAIQYIKEKMIFVFQSPADPPQTFHVYHPFQALLIAFAGQADCRFQSEVTQLHLLKKALLHQ